MDIRFLGTFSIGRGGSASLCPGIGGPGRECVAHLFQNPDRQFDRDLLIERIWSRSGTIDPRGALNSTLSRLRAALRLAGPQAEDCLESDKWSVRLAADPGFDVDSLALGRLARRGAGAEEAIAQAWQIYAGNFLPGCTGFWAVTERERLLSLYVATLLRACGQLAGEGRLQMAIACCRTILLHDPLRERVHRRLMLLHAASREPHLSRRHFEEFRRFLRDSCDTDPLPETCELAALLAGGNRAAAAAAFDAEFSASLPA